MARTVTLDELVSRLEKETDTENDTHLSTTEKREYIAAAASETWDHIISTGESDKHVKSSSFNTIANTLTYDLQSATYVPDTDFYKVATLYVDEGNGQRRPLMRINPAEVMSFRPVQAVVPIILYYIPTAPTFKVAGAFVGSSTFDGISGWEDHVVQGAAIKVAVKKNEDSSPYRRRKMELEERMAHMGSANWGEPARIVRRRSRAQDPWALWRQTVNAFNLRGDKLELYYLHGYQP